MTKSLGIWVAHQAHQASLSGLDLCFLSAATTDEEGKRHIAAMAPKPTTSWGSQLNLALDPCMDLDYGEGKDAPPRRTAFYSLQQGLHSVSFPDEDGSSTQLLLPLPWGDARWVQMPNWLIDGPPKLKPPDPFMRGRDCPWPRMQ